MKVTMLAGAMLLAIMLIVPCTASAWTITVENQTGKTIRELYISHVETDDWEIDVLRPEESNMRLMHNGQSMRLNLDRSDYYDMLVIFQDRSEQEYRNIDIRANNYVVINRYDIALFSR